LSSEEKASASGVTLGNGIVYLHGSPAGPLCGLNQTGDKVGVRVNFDTKPYEVTFVVKGKALSSVPLEGLMGLLEKGDVLVPVVNFTQNAEGTRVKFLGFSGENNIKGE